MQSDQLAVEARAKKQSDALCYHCGQSCKEGDYLTDQKSFCCYGCKTVYEILNENNLCEYYDYEANPGVRFEIDNDDTFAYLDEVRISEKILLYNINGMSRVQFYIPVIHCISCIWLLENLNRLNAGVIKSEVNFAKKTVLIDFNSNQITLGKVAALLASTGYKPLINLEAEAQPKNRKYDNTLVLQLAIAGFCFGNIMLLSFPEYLGIDHADEKLKQVFSYLNIFLALPVVLYSGRDYFISAWKSFRQKQVNIDVPIAVGILVLFVRSTSDILLQQGPGYMDSLAGLVFFLLIGRWFQNKTYESLAFDRDYKSYFPLAVYKQVGEEWKACIIHELKKGDVIRIRNKEIIPADSLLLSEFAYIDYSFVTGEANPVKVIAGELVYAGGRVTGQSARMTIVKETSQSHLTSLWNNDVFSKPDRNNYKSLIDRVAKIFTWSVLGLALATGAYWYWADAERVWLIVTAVLMVACPCALALAAPFTYGSMLRVLGNHGLYLKNADIIETMAGVDAIVFDKTGTITHGSNAIAWIGNISKDELIKVKSVASCSTHPLSILIAKSIKEKELTLTQFDEFPGRGVQGLVEGKLIKIGSAEFTGQQPLSDHAASRVYISIDGDIKGYFELRTTLRPGIKVLVEKLGYRVKALLSGDSAADEIKMKSVFQPYTTMAFLQSPQDKLNYISGLQKKGNKVMMLGDGLNDSGALKQSDVGIAVADDTGVFTPSCDGILSGAQLDQLDRFLDLSKSALIILKVSLGISLLYNVLGLSFAVTGHLTPLVAAILMPVSSISVVVFTTFMVNLVAQRKLS
ncbi:MAG TPA: heavy metal translocating P-type ATPase [Cytophagales bacterium]|nr:heavy metal translocating P-type ATPase [Cytophagales bacterium]